MDFTTALALDGYAPPTDEDWAWYLEATYCDPAEREDWEPYVPVDFPVAPPF